jgi:hypothetical protein
MKGHELKAIDYDADYLWECECGALGEDLTERDRHLTVSVAAILDKHIASVTSEMDAGEGEWTDLDGPRDDIGDYIGDQRQCACGRHIDGFYEYVEHLKEVLS